MNIFSSHSSSCLWHISCSWRSEQAALIITASPRNILAQPGHHNPQRGMNHFGHEGTEDEWCSCRAQSSLQHTSHLQESMLHLHVQNMSSLCKPLLLRIVNVLDPFIQKLHPTAFLWLLSASLVILHSLTAFHLTSWCSFNLPISLPPSCQMSQPCAWSQSLLLLWKIVMFSAQVTLLADEKGMVADCWEMTPLLLLCFPHSWLFLFPQGSVPSGTPLTLDDDASWH